MAHAASLGIVTLALFFTAPAQGGVPRQGAPEGSRAYHADINALARASSAYRRVLFTGQRTQIVIMSIPPGGDIGEEQHQRVEQILVNVEGEGTAVINGVASRFRSGDVVVLMPGVRHNLVNTGKAPLKLYTIYAPPNHIQGRVHATKADAEADVEDEAFGRSVE